MPLETFYNLDDEKRNRVIHALMDEYTNSPLEEVSIKNIVNKAKIPRGSFYQYFVDKEDVLKYLISHIRKEGEGELGDDFFLYNKDIFDSIQFILHREVKLLRGKNLSTHMRLLNQITKSARALNIFNEEISKAASESALFKRYWAATGFNHLTEDENKIIMNLLISSLKEALLAILLDNTKIEEIQHQLKIKLLIIKEGIRIVLNTPFEKQEIF